MRSRLRYKMVVGALVGVCLTGCAPEEEGSDPLVEVLGTAQMGLSKANGGLPSDWDYCVSNDCVAGEGDCDNDVQCGGAAGLVCGANNGSRFNLYRGVDTCWPSHCENGVQDVDEVGVDIGGSCDACGGANGDFDFCSPACPCAAGQGDCDVDADCLAGNVCGVGNAGRFGLAKSVGVCWPSTCENGVLDGDETGIDFGGSCGGSCGGTNGDWAFCSTDCPCSEGEGDCDSDAECVDGTVCSDSRGYFFGLHRSVGVCTRTGCYSSLFAFCEPWCPCGIGEGDCDFDEDCFGNLVCDTSVVVGSVHVCVSP